MHTPEQINMQSLLSLVDEARSVLSACTKRSPRESIPQLSDVGLLLERATQELKQNL